MTPPPAGNGPKNSGLTRFGSLIEWVWPIVAALGWAIAFMAYYSGGFSAQMAQLENANIETTARLNRAADVINRRLDDIQLGIKSNADKINYNEGRMNQISIEQRDQADRISRLETQQMGDGGLPHGRR